MKEILILLKRRKVTLKESVKFRRKTRKKDCYCKDINTKKECLENLPIVIGNNKFWHKNVKTIWNM